MLKNEKKLKDIGVFVGFNGAGAAGIYSFTRVLRDRGYKIDFYGIGEIYFKQQVDELLIFPKNPFNAFIARWKLFFKILPKYDIWHFNWSKTLFFYPLNILLLKLYGKKVVVTFRGSDVETDLDFLKTNQEIKNQKLNWPDYYKNYYHRSVWAKLYRRVRSMIMVKMADRVILSGPYLAHSVAHYDQIIGNALNLDQIESVKSNKSQENFTILHAPTDPKVKGTDIIEKAFNNLSKNFPECNFKILKVTDHNHLLEEMSKASIVIDQLLVGWYGVQALEALVLGKTVMCFINDPYLKLMDFDQPLPVVNTNAFSFEQDLANLIKAGKFKESNLAGQHFVHKYFNQEKIADQFEQIYKQVYHKL